MQKYKSRDDCESDEEFIKQFKSLDEWIKYQDQKNMLLLMEPLKENNFGKWRYDKMNLDDYLIAVVKADDGQYEVMVEDNCVNYKNGVNISFYSPIFCNLDNGRLLKSTDFNKLQTAFIKNKILTEVFKIEEWGHNYDYEE